MTLKSDLERLSLERARPRTSASSGVMLIWGTGGYPVLPTLLALLPVLTPLLLLGVLVWLGVELEEAPAEAPECGGA